jgi:hydrogen peroxide-dependent heme synthase
LTGFAPPELAAGCDEFVQVLNPAGSQATVRMQISVVSGHKADFGLMLMDPDPLKIDAVHQRLLASRLGPAVLPTYSFVSMTEISEYVPTVEQYAARLVREGERRKAPAIRPKSKPMPPACPR